MNVVRSIYLSRFDSEFELRDDGKVYQISGKKKFDLRCEYFMSGLVPEMYDIVDICGSYSHALCLRRDGRVYSFGSFSCGQLGRFPCLTANESDRYTKDCMEELWHDETHFDDPFRGSRVTTLVGAFIIIHPHGTILILSMD